MSEIYPGHPASQVKDSYVCNDVFNDDSLMIGDDLMIDDDLMMMIMHDDLRIMTPFKGFPQPPCLRGLP